MATRQVDLPIVLKFVGGKDAEKTMNKLKKTLSELQVLLNSVVGIMEEIHKLFELEVKEK